MVPPLYVSPRMRSLKTQQPRRRTASRLVGVDFESSSIAATELHVNGGIVVSNFGVQDLDPGVVRDGEIRDPEALGDALKELFTEHKLPRQVRLGIANQQVAVRTLRLPKLEKQSELAAAVRFSAEDHIPMPLEDAVLDWQLIPGPPITDPDSGREVVEVVAVAARREMLAPAIEAIRRGGLRLVGIDHSAFALIRALAREDAIASTPQPDATASDPSLDVEASLPALRLICNLGDVTNLAVARGSACVFSRVLNFGTEGIAESLAEKSGLRIDHARQWLVHVGLAAPLDQVEGDPQIVAAARAALAAGAARLVDELRRSIEYYATLDDRGQISEIVLTGAGIAIPGLVDELRMTLPMPLEAATPAPLVSAAGAGAGRLTLSYGLGLEN